MDILEAMNERHSVRQYTDQPIGEDMRAQLQAEIDACNAEGGLHMQLVCDDADAFTKGEKGYGQFENVRNYLAIVGQSGADEACGYYGQRVVLLAQQLGLNSCWVALTFTLQGPGADGLPRVAAKSSFMPYATMDLGIAKYHFEVAAGKENFAWA